MKLPPTEPGSEHDRCTQAEKKAAPKKLEVAKKQAAPKKQEVAKKKSAYALRKR